MARIMCRCIDVPIYLLMSLLICLVILLAHPSKSRADEDLIGDLINKETKQPAPLGPLIVIDPGHGGKDTGAIGHRGIREKDIVLQISRKLAASLRKQLKARVILTRNGDRFISLDERDKIAVNKRAAVFISVHANAAKRKEAEGIEIYYLNNATDEAASRLAARENKGSQKSLSDLQSILSTMIQTESTELSHHLARSIYQALKKPIEARYKLKRLQIKSALFYVLVGSKAPSVLLEVGFVTNPRESRRLRQVEYQSRFVDAVTKGIDKYFKMLNSGKVNL